MLGYLQLSIACNRDLSVDRSLGTMFEVAALAHRLLCAAHNLCFFGFWQQQANCYCSFDNRLLTCMVDYADLANRG